MKRWRAAFLLAFLAALSVLLSWSRSPDLLQDSDTQILLGTIRRVHDPLKWLRGDWPLENHFYRPVVSLVLEADNALWGNDARGYAFTNALLCAACVLLLFWALREITDRPWPSAAGAAVFALWHVGPILQVAGFVGYAAWATLAVGMVRHRHEWRRYLPAFLTLLALSYEILPIRSLEYRMIGWIPGRTASTMTVFCLAAIAAYARFERLRRPSFIPSETTPETPPATRHTRPATRNGIAWPWAIVAVACTALALGSYEQAVMLPAVLALVALAMRRNGTTPLPRDEPRGGGGGGGGDKAPLWPLHAAFWGLIVVYLGLRWELLPHTVSAYQRQQYSSTRTAFWLEMEYLFPPLKSVSGIPETLSAGWLMLLQTDTFAPLVQAAIIATGYLQARREPTLALVGYLGSALAFAPMAWFKIFEHYHYWPMAMRAAFVVALGAVAFRLMATAWSPPGLPAPPRLRPAPGSLPRP